MIVKSVASSLMDFINQYINRALICVFLLLYAEDCSFKDNCSIDEYNTSFITGKKISFSIINIKVGFVNTIIFSYDICLTTFN